jgi:D-alanyl-lipoteichoic acid acyltransferase DltB (MBOAT superfamily)
MLFNSLSFLLLFLPITFVGYYGLAFVGDRWAAVWLVAASFVFYSWWSFSLVFLLAGSIAFNFICGALILRAKTREPLQIFLLTLGICGNLSLLFYYKYLFAILNWLGFHGVISLVHPYSVILPLGISFFTFTQIGYLVDCKGGVVKTNRLLDYCLFVTFFPHLIAGPIIHHREMMPQFADPNTYRFRWDNLASGMTLFIIGLTKKVVLADQFILPVSNTFGNNNGLPFLQAWDGALSYSLQVYFDFSGYSDMACGLALFFGLRFPANFNSPYRATSIIDYWQRWHMTFTRYLTLYLYNPVSLEISRRRLAQGKSVSRKAIATPSGFLSMIAFPTFFTMIPAGAWHGAGLQFLIFGLLHGTYLTINHAWRSFGPRVPETSPHSALKITATVGKIALTYLAVLVAQIFFRSASVHDALRLLSGMVGTNGIFSSTAPPLIEPGIGYLRYLGLVHPVMLVLLYALVWFAPNSLQILDRVKPTLSPIKQDSLFVLTWKPTVAWAMAVGIVAVLTFLNVTGTTEFLYFRF